MNKEIVKDMVSVVIPSYNRRDTIINCLNSVLNQTYKNIEVIIVDDGSGDNTKELFENYSDERVRYYYYSPNKGACHARNYGINRSRGEYIAFQDSDDEWIEDKIEKQLEFIKKKQADFVFCGMNRINPQTGENYYYPNADFDDDKDSLEQLLTQNSISTQTILITRKAAEIIAFDESFRRYQDWDFSLQAAAKGLKICYMKGAYINSEIQTNSISATVKSGVAGEHLYNKYKEYYKIYPMAHSAIYRKMGLDFRKSDRKKTLEYLKKSLNLGFDFKTFVKLVLYKLHLWN